MKKKKRQVTMEELNALNVGGPQLVEPSEEEKAMLAQIDAKQAAAKQAPKESLDMEDLGYSETIVGSVPRTPVKKAAPVVKSEPRKITAQAAPEKQEVTSKTPEPVQEQEVAEEKKGGMKLSDNFKRAIGHLAPSAIGMLVGGLIEGTDGAVAGYEKGAEITNQLHDLARQDQQIETAQQNADTQRMFAENSIKKSQSDKSKKRLSTNWVDADNNPVIEKDGIPVDAQGNPISTDKLKRYVAPIDPLEAARMRNYENIEKNREFRRAQANEGDAQRALKDMRGTEEYKQSSKMLTQVPTIRGLINDAVANGGQSLSMLGPKVAKGIAGEVGVLTEQDVKRYVQDPSLAGSMRDSLLKMKSGKLSEVSADNLSRLVDIMEKKANDQIEKAVSREAKLFSRRSGLSESEARGLIDENAGISGKKEQFDVQSKEERKQRIGSKLFTR